MTEEPIDFMIRPKVEAMLMKEKEELQLWSV